MALGYATGQAFGDPSKMTRSTGEDEINRLNQYMRSQPWWQQIRGTGTGDFTDAQKKQIVQQAAANGINLPGAFHIDEGGNINQKSRTKRNIAIAALIGGAVATGGLAASGAFAGGAGAAGGGAAAGAGGAAAGTAAGTGAVLGSTAVGGGLATGAGLAGGTAVLTASPGIAAGFGSMGAAAGLGGGALHALGGYQGIARAAGAGLRGMASDAAGDRSDQANAGYATDQMNLQREAENRAERNDAWRGMMHAEYMQNRPQYHAREGLPTFGTTPGPNTPAMQQGAAGLSAETLKRLTQGSQLPAMTDYNKLAKPGGFERIARYAAPVMGFLGGR